MTLNEKIMNFIATITNAYQDEENQQPLQKMVLDDNMTEDFVALIFAMKVFFETAADRNIDLIDFTHLLNKLAVQHLLEKKEEADENE